MSSITQTRAGSCEPGSTQHYSTAPVAASLPPSSSSWHAAGFEFEYESKIESAPGVSGSGTTWVRSQGLVPAHHIEGCSRWQICGSHIDETREQFGGSSRTSSPAMTSVNACCTTASRGSAFEPARRRGLPARAAGC